MFTLFSLYADWSLLALRLVLGSILLAHGFPKLMSLKQTAENFSAMGFKPGKFWGTLVAFVESFGGLCILLGIFTEYASGIFIGEFIVTTAWRYLKKHPFAGGYELDLLILVAMGVLLTLGSGAYSLSNYFWGGF